MEIPLPEVFQKILDAIQRSSATAATASEVVSSLVNGCVNDAKNYLRIVNQYRFLKYQHPMKPRLSKLIWR